MSAPPPGAAQAELQDAALSAWGGKPANFGAGQKEFHKWSRLNGLARGGAFQAGMEQQAA